MTNSNDNKNKAQPGAKAQTSSKEEAHQDVFTPPVSQTSQAFQNSTQEKSTNTSTVRLNTLFAFKMGMSSIYDDQNRKIPVTFLQYKDVRITQVKKKKVEGYDAIQVAIEDSRKLNQPIAGHLKKIGLTKGASHIRETRQDLPEGVQLGQGVSIDSLKKGDLIFVTGVSKGHGFSGVVKRWGFKGGPASHGAEKQRTTGSIANTATQGRVFPGKKLPGRFGCDRTTQKSQVIDVIPNQGVILVKGPVAGAKKSLVEIRRCEAW